MKRSATSQMLKGPCQRGNAMRLGEPQMLGSCSQEKNQLERTPNRQLNGAHQHHCGPEL